MYPDPEQMQQAQDAMDEAALQQHLHALGLDRESLQPRLSRPPDARVLGLRLPGAALDSAARGVAGLTPPRPRNFGQGLLVGAVTGLAGSRARSALGRQDANATEQKRVDALGDERRKAVSDHARELRNWRTDQAKESATGRRADATLAETRRHNIATERLAGQKAQPSVDPGDYSHDVETDDSGRQWLDLSRYKGKEYESAQDAARSLGAAGLDAAGADALRQVDNAMRNIASLREASVGLLPKNGQARLLGGPVNAAQAWTQIGPKAASLAAWKSYRLAAINALRAAAGSKGLRINQAEIRAATENDIPQITDSQEVADAKFDRVTQLLQNAASAAYGVRPNASGSAKGRPFGGARPSLDAIFGQ